VILEERNMRVDNEPSARLSEQMGAMQYLNHPYHHPTIGWRHEMETLDRTDALDSLVAFYAPENAVLVCGATSSRMTWKAFAEKTYGKIPRHAPSVERKRPQEPPQIAERRVTFADPRVTQPSLQRTYLVPSSPRPKATTLRARRAAHILGGGSNSWLNRAHCHGASASRPVSAPPVPGDFNSMSPASASTARRQRRVARKARGGIDTVIATFLEKGPTTRRSSAPRAA